MSARAYLALGSNLGDRAETLGRTRAALVATPGLRLVAASAVVETDPVDVTDQPKFLNQVLGVDTDLAPRELLDACLEVERSMGRDRASSVPKGPRTIDVDVLLYDGGEVDEPGLVVPHPRLGRRPFLLELCREVGAPADWIPEESHAEAP